VASVDLGAFAAARAHAAAAENVAAWHAGAPVLRPVRDDDPVLALPPAEIALAPPALRRYLTLEAIAAETRAAERAVAQALAATHLGDLPLSAVGRALPMIDDAGVRAALWREAGPARDAAGLERLTGDPYPLARLIAQSALARRESRGCHMRTDFPVPDKSLDGTHQVVADGAGAAVWG